MPKTIQKIYLLCALVVFANTTSAQDDCAFTLSRAQRLFDAGNIEQIPQMLKPCMEKGFTSEEKQQAQKLIILSYLFDKNEADAEKTMFDFLRKYPEYELSTSDQAEFAQLFGTYRTLPIASIGLSGGLNTSQITLVEIYDPIDAIGEYTSPTPGYHVGLSFRFYLIDKLDLNIEANYIQTEHEYYNDMVAGGSTVTLNEIQTNVAVPLSVIYTPISFKKIAPFVRAGISTKYMLTSTMQGERSVLALNKPIATPDFSMIDSRNPLQLQLLGSVGFTYNLKRSYVLFDVRYNHGLMLQSNSKKGIEAPNQEIWSTFLVEENGIVMNNFSVTVGLFYKFYKPRKR